MENEINWMRVWTGRDFLAQLLIRELDAAGIRTKIRSQTESAHLAGFGSSGLAQVLINVENEEEALPIVAAFDKRQTEGI